MAEGPADRRRTFLPVVGTGVAAGVLAAVAAARPWAKGFDATTGHAPLLPTGGDAGEMPLAAALSLVVLASWGALLVTRAAARRGVALLAVAASVGLGVTVVVGAVTLPGRLLDDMREGGASSATLGTETTPWFWVAAGSAAVLVATGLLALAWCPAWPEMGTRYDAPGPAGAGADDAPPEERSNLELWRSMDEGRDPTA